MTIRNCKKKYAPFSYRGMLFSILIFSFGTLSFAQTKYDLTIQFVPPNDSIVTIEFYVDGKFQFLDSFKANKTFKRAVLPFVEPTLVRIRNNNKMQVFMVGKFKNNVVWDLPRNKLIVKGEDNINEVYEIFQNTIQQKYAIKFFELNLLTEKQNIPYDTLVRLRKYIQDSLYIEVIKFIKEYNSSFYSLHLLNHYSSILQFDIVRELYCNLDISLKEFPSAKRIEALIAKRKEYFDFSLLEYYSNPIDKDKIIEFYVIDFWGSWCKPCVSAIPRLQNIQRKFENKKIQFISISYETQKTLGVFSSLQKKFFMPWPQVLVINDESKNTIIDTYSITDFPTYMIVDAKHKILLRESGENGLKNIEKFLIKSGL